MIQRIIKINRNGSVTQRRSRRKGKGWGTGKDNRQSSKDRKAK